MFARFWFVFMYNAYVFDKTFSEFIWCESERVSAIIVWAYEIFIFVDFDEQLLHFKIRTVVFMNLYSVLYEAFEWTIRHFVAVMNKRLRMIARIAYHAILINQVFEYVVDQILLTIAIKIALIHVIVSDTSSNIFAATFAIFSFASSKRIAISFSSSLFVAGSMHWASSWSFFEIVEQTAVFNSRVETFAFLTINEERNCVEKERDFICVNILKVSSRI